MSNDTPKRDRVPWRRGSSFQCACGQPGFVDLGEAAETNRYPCLECYHRLRQGTPYTLRGKASHVR